MSVQELGGASCIALGEADAYRGVQRLPGCQASGGRLPAAAPAEPGTEHPGFSPADTSAAAWWWRQRVGMAGVRAAGPGPGVRFSDMHDLAPGLQLGLLVLVHFPRC